MFTWLREYFELKRDYRICQSCETLKQQLEIANYEKKQLLDRILAPHIPIEIKSVQQTEVNIPKTVPWNVRRRMLETEDREKAKLMRNAPIPSINQSNDKISVEEFEKELKSVESEREAQK